MKEEILVKTEIRVRTVRLGRQDRRVNPLERVNVESLVFLGRVEATANQEIEDRLDSPVFPVFQELRDLLDPKVQRETLDSPDQEVPQAFLDHRVREVELEAPGKMVLQVAQDQEVTLVTEEREAPVVDPGYLDLRDCQVHLDQPVQLDQPDQREIRVALVNLDLVENREAMEHLVNPEETARKEKVALMDHLDHQAQLDLLGLLVSADSREYQDREEKMDQKDQLASEVRQAQRDQLVTGERGVERAHRVHQEPTAHLESLDKRVHPAKTVFLACKEDLEREVPVALLDHQALLVLRDSWV